MNRKYSTELLIDKLKEFYIKNGRVPGMKDFENNNDYPSYRTYSSKFGSWNKALEIAGFNLNHMTNLSDEELLKYIIQFYDENKRPPTQKNFTRNSKYPSSSVYRKRFGSWNKALELVGLNLNVMVNLTDEELLEFLLKFENETGKVPVQRDFKNNDSFPSYSPYIKRFGSWANALKLVGLDVDSLVNQGIVKNEYQKGRKAELIVIKHFRKNPVDLAGENCSSPCDGICPNGLSYDVKSGAIKDSGGFSFTVENKYKEKIKIFYLLGFDKNYENLLYAWRVPEILVGKKVFYVGIRNAKFNMVNMKNYEITTTIKQIIEEKMQNENNNNT